ncbi:hypothetical protein ABPG72_001509 [Tetrahymena utriculariae]
MIDNLGSLKFDQLFKYRIIYQIIVAIQEILLLTYFFISSSTLQQKLAGLFILLSLFLRIILSGYIIKEQCQNNQSKYSGSNEDQLNSKSLSIEKITNNLENWKLGNRIKEQPQKIRREWLKVIKQLFVLIPQIIAKINLLNAVIQAQNSSLILFLNYYFDEKTFLLIGARKFLNINMLISNMLIKFFPFCIILGTYLKDNSIFNQALSQSIHSNDIIWIGIIIFIYFIGDQFYHIANQKILANSQLVKQYLQNNRQNIVKVADSFVISFYSKHQNQSDLLPGVFNNNNNNNNNNNKLSMNGTNSQFFQGINNNSNLNILKQASLQKKTPILKKNMSHSKSGILENCDQQQARSYESSIDEAQNSLFLSDIMDLIPYGIAILNSQHSVIYNNNKILELLDCDKQNVIKIITGLSTANAQSSQLSSMPKPQKPSTSQFANKKYESSIDNVLTQAYANDDQGQAISKNSFLFNDNYMLNSANNIQHPTSSIKGTGTNGNQAFNNSYININVNMNNSIAGNPNINKQQSINDSQQEGSQYSGEKIQLDQARENSFEKKNMNGYQDDLKQKESNIEGNKSSKDNQNKQSSLSSPLQSHISQDGQDHRYKQSTGKFGGSINEVPLEQWNSNMRVSNKEQIKFSKQQTSESKNKMINSLTFKANTHFKNGNGTVKNANSNMVNKYCDSENNTGSNEELASPFIQSEKHHIQDIRNLNQETNIQLKFAHYQDQNGSLHQKNNQEEENKSYQQINLNKTQEIVVSDISRIDEKNVQNNESVSCLKSNSVTNQNLDETNNLQANLDISKIAQEKYLVENHIPQSENQFISFNLQEMNQNQQIRRQKYKDQNKKDNKSKIKSKFSKKIPSANYIQNSEVNKIICNQKPTEDQIKIHQTENICQSQPDENHHNHIQKKQIKKQISIFTPQLKQRNIKVGQLISSMFDNQIDDTRTYGGVKKSNSRNLLITQLSEQIESNYSRNHSLLGQINSTKNIGFYQYKNNEACMQVVYKGKQLIVRLIPCEFQYDFEDNNSPPTADQSLVLIQVEPFWEELFQEKIEDFSKRKMQLFGSLCHELRTPLNCSISFLDLYKQLKEGSEDEADVNEFIEPSLRSNQLMLNMVNDILDFVQMTENKFKFNPISFNLVELLEECLLLIKVHADIKNINLQLKKNDLVPKTIVSDPNRIRQIILNFLSNSLKFTKNFGTIQLEAQGLEQANTQSQQMKQSSIVKVTVTDTGIGISKSNIKKIFEIFNKTDHKDTSINPNGCGIGLPLSNSLAKLIGPLQPIIIKENNGNQIQIWSGIQVESVEGKGSSFSFLIQDLNSKIYSEKDFRKSCDIIEFGENDQLQSQLEPNNLRILSQINNHIPHLYIKQDVAGGMKIFHFQQNINTPAQYLSDNLSETKIKSYQSSVIKNSNKTVEINSSGPIEKIPSNILLNKSRRTTDGFKKTSTEFEINLSKPVIQTVPKTQTQVFSFPQSSNLVSIYDNNNNNNNSNLNSPLGGIKQPLQIPNKLSSPKNNYSLYEKRTDSKSINVSNMNNISSIAQFRNMNSATIQSQATQDMDIQSLKGYNNQQITTQSQIALFPTQLPSQTMLKQNSGNIQPQGQIQKALLDKTNNFSINSKGEETKILIADDSGFNIMVLKKIIQLFHIQNIHICHDGQEAVTKVRDVLNNPKERLYDMIFMDLDMPIMNGYEACKQIKQLIQDYEISDQLYIIACSAYGMQVKEEHAFHISQLDDAITKPIKKDQIQNVLQTFIRDKTRNR